MCVNDACDGMHTTACLPHCVHGDQRAILFVGSDLSPGIKSRPQISQQVHSFIHKTKQNTFFGKLSPCKFTIILQLETTQIMPIGKARNIDSKTCLM